MDDGREIVVDDLAVAVADDGTLRVRLGDRTYAGLAAAPAGRGGPGRTGPRSRPARR